MQQVTLRCSAYPQRQKRYYSGSQSIKVTSKLAEGKAVEYWPIGGVRRKNVMSPHWMQSSGGVGCFLHELNQYWIIGAALFRPCRKGRPACFGIAHYSQPSRGKYHWMVRVQPFRRNDYHRGERHKGGLKRRPHSEHPNCYQMGRP